MAKLKKQEDVEDKAPTTMVVVGVESPKGKPQHLVPGRKYRMTIENAKAAIENGQAKDASGAAEKKDASGSTPKKEGKPPEKKDPKKK